MTQLDERQQRLIQQFRARKQAEQSRASNIDTAVDYGTDVARSIGSGLIQGGFAATPLGMGLNITHGVSEATRAAAQGISNYLMDEDFKRAPNPIPTSGQFLQGALTPLNLETYKPQTTPGEYARTGAEFVAGGKLAAKGLPASAQPTMRQLIGGGLASEAAGQATEGTEYEMPARLVAGYLGGRVLQPRQRMAAASEVKELSRQKFREAAEAGGIAPIDLGDDIANTVNKAAPQSFVQKIVRGKDADIDALSDRMEAFRGKRISFEDIQELDVELGQLARSPKALDMGRPTAFGRAIGIIQDEIRDVVNKSNIKGVPQWREAQKLYSASRKLDDIEDVLYRANLMRNPQQGLQTGLRSLAEKARKRGGMGYSPKEIELIEKAATDGTVGDLFRSFGSRLSGIVALGSGDLGTTAAVTAATKGARSIAEKAQLRKVGNVQREISKRAIPLTNTQTTGQRALGVTVGASPNLGREAQGPQQLTEEQLRLLQQFRRGRQ